MADVTKLSGYAVLGESDIAALATKLSGYAVLGESDIKVVATKLTAYAVVQFTNKVRPQVSVCT